MEIILLRHGKPDFSTAKRIAIRELPKMIATYNCAGVSQLPPASSVQMARACKHVVCSDLLRSVQSAKLLGVEQIDLSEPLFREADLPVTLWPSMKMSPYFWLVVFRILWFFGHSADGESITQARLRAATAMQQLDTLAQTHGRVLFVGHGILNQFIAKELLSYGWQGPKRPARDHWGFSRYTLMK